MWCKMSASYDWSNCFLYVRKLMCSSVKKIAISFISILLWGILLYYTSLCFVYLHFQIFFGLIQLMPSKDFLYCFHESLVLWNLSGNILFFWLPAVYVASFSKTHMCSIICSFVCLMFKSVKHSLTCCVQYCNVFHGAFPCAVRKWQVAYTVACKCQLQ